MKIAIADVDEAGLTKTGRLVSAIVGETNLLIVPTDVSKKEQVEALRDKVYELWGEVSHCDLSVVSATAHPVCGSALVSPRAACFNFWLIAESPRLATFAVQRLFLGKADTDISFHHHCTMMFSVERF